MKLLSWLLSTLLATSTLALPSSSQDVIHTKERRSITAAGATMPLLPSSLDKRDNSNNNNNDNTVNLCHSPTSRYYIHFFDPANPNITLYVYTQWIILYPKQLRPKILAAGFTYTTPRNMARCGWTLVDEVSAQSVDRGDIGYRQTLALDANTTFVPSEETVAQLRDILLSTYPALEICLIVGVFVVLPFALFLCCVCTAGWRDRRTTRRRKQALKAAKAAKKRQANFELGCVEPKNSSEPPPYS